VPPKQQQQQQQQHQQQKRKSSTKSNKSIKSTDSKFGIFTHVRKFNNFSLMPPQNAE